MSWTVKPVNTAVIARWRRLPTFHESPAGLIDLDAKRVAGVDGILGIFPPRLDRQVALGTGGYGAEQVYLGHEFKVVPLPGGRRLHEVAVVPGKTGHLEYVEDVVDVALVRDETARLPAPDSSGSSSRSPRRSTVL